MTFEMQYNLVDYVRGDHSIVINKTQTLLALYQYNKYTKKTDIYSMETGIRISRYG